MLSSKLLNKIKRFANKFSREAREVREQIQNKAKEIVNQYKKKLAYFCQELTLMMPRVELKNLFGMDLARVMLLVAVLMTLPNVCTYAQGVPATTGSTNNDGKGIDVKSVAGKAFDTVYQQWRLPVCALLFFLAIFFYFQGGEQGLIRAVGVVIGMVAWALVPYFRDTVFSWFGQALN